jgi:ribosomal protein L13
VRFFVTPPAAKVIVVDADGHNLGRLEVAMILRGKVQAKLHTT